MTTPWFLWETARASLAEWAESVHLSHGGSRLTGWAPVPGAGELQAVVWVGADGPPVPRVPLSGHALGWVLREGVSLTAEAREVFRGLGGGWLVAVPVLDPEGVAIGALSLEREDPPSRTLVRSLELAAVAAGRLLFTAAAYQQASDDLRKDRELRQNLERLERELDLDAIVRSACEAARSACDADGGLTALWDPERDEGRITAVTGHLPSDLEGATFAGEASHLGLALRTPAVLPREHAKAWGELPPFVPGLRAPVGSFIVAPMLDRDVAIGGLAVAYEKPRAFREADIRRLEILARFVGPGLRNATQYATLSAEAKVDPLTGLANRRGLEERLRSEMVAARQGHVSLALALIDLDHFKEVNDRWGHDAGDAALRAVSRIVQDSIRPGDAAGRWGGEELLVVLPGAPLQVAAEVADRVRRGVESAEVYWQGRTIELRVSAGVSAYPATVPKPDQLVPSADAALYHAKRSGRNVVAVAGDAGAHGFTLYRGAGARSSRRG